ncbi:uncharacterized protein FIBRA_07043 [Fibroporia radiculosa]|uniref:Uncharacterized protein n=1 Tax=Fibroporia radiculosa TaxID=599839 RepID=J4GU80_9APHY|nr:uncharacterized protein FIBRA_07043 [Fibroporia radiculosa]CCM04850.1 predicted protein [Fibroporia radiculosa]
MEKETDWNALFSDHPIFSLPKGVAESAGKNETSLELSLGSLPEFTEVDPEHDGPTPSGRRQVMIIKDAELIVAAGNEIRMASLLDSKLGRPVRKSYKILHTPNIQFEIHQLALSPHGKLLAVAGASQVAVVVLPRAGFTKLVPSTIDCKTIQVGQFYHAVDTSAPVAKIEWHPWGEGGTTLMVMTTDGKLREYDMSVDSEEPQQTLFFVPDKKKNSFIAEDESEREVVSFTLGKGRADWGPLSIYAITRSGDIYAICPYMPKNASIPLAYVHALECFVAAKQEFLARSPEEGTSSNGLENMYEYQHKYVAALVKQLPSDDAHPEASRFILMHPPSIMKNPPVRQGPFLLQPSPRTLEGSEGGDATDIIYLAFENEAEEAHGDMERLGVLLTSFQDGRVDVYLDLEKVEARWEHKHDPDSDLPMLAVYETVDLGIVSSLSKIPRSESDPSFLELLRGNHPVLFSDPIHDDTVYVHHAFGVHALQLGPLLRSLVQVLRGGSDNNQDDNAIGLSAQDCKPTVVQLILNTLSIERKCSSPVVGLSIPNDIYLTYSLFILTSAMCITVFPLNLRSETPYSISSELPLVPENTPSKLQSSSATPPTPAYISLLTQDTYVIPSALAQSATSLISRLPPSPSQGEFVLTPDTMRYLGTVVEKFGTKLHEIAVAHRGTEMRAAIQRQEFARQREKCKEMLEIVSRLKGPRHAATQEKLKNIESVQKKLMGRLDRVLQLLIQKASPDLSENETRWFNELKRMKEEVVGRSKYDDRSLVARSKLLRREVDRLLPQLKELKGKERERKRRLAEDREALGVSQAFELGKRSNAERVRINSIEDEILNLAARLDVTLGRPPSSQSQSLDP